MRRISRRHGTTGAGGFTAPEAGSRARSSGVTPRWSRGSSRKYSHHTTTQTRLTTPSTANAPRQVPHTMSAATTGGVTALPSRANECVTPWAKPRLLGGVQFCIARVAVGNVAPSPKPSATRNAISDTRPTASPVSAVATAQIAPHTSSVLRGPNRSPIRPPIT